MMHRLTHGDGSGCSGRGKAELLQLRLQLDRVCRTTTKASDPQETVRTDAMMHRRCRGLPVATVAVAVGGAKAKGRRRRSRVEDVREGN
jgi:hypothetical protein